ncbi:MAG: hypothetical protein KC645_16005 [Gemmatimonadetes bacterium]|nr:hypothetical protein [Gemmatimonadota bacterium]
MDARCVRWRWCAPLLALCVLPPPLTGQEPGTFAGIREGLPTGSAAIASTGLVLAWDMETRTADGRLRDFSGRGHHGELGVTTPVAGLLGGALAFARVAERVHVAEHADLDLEGPLTIAAWMRVDSLGLHQHVLACDDVWAFWITPDDRYRLGDTRGGGVSTAPGTVRRGRWSSVVVVLDGTAGDAIDTDLVRIWVDGRPAPADTHLRSAAAAEGGRWNPGDLHRTDACYAGFESHQGNEAHQSMPFVGALDEVLVFERAWTEQEIVAFSARFGAEERAVLDVAERFFAAMAARDTTRLAPLSHPALTLVATSAVGDSTVARASDRATFFRQIAGADRVPIERLWDARVQVREGIATVWAPYDLYWDSTFSHCGIDAFQMVRTGRRWQVTSIVYTVERPPARCETHPDGPP